MKFNIQATQKANRALKELRESSIKTVEKKDNYSEQLMENKIEFDAKFLNSIAINLEESKQLKFSENLQELLESTYKLYKLSDEKPRLYSPIVGIKELTESEILDKYKNKLIDKINSNYSKPLMEGTLVQDHKEQATLILESAIKSNVTEVDSEKLVKYALFENEMTNEIKEIMIPEILENNIINYINDQDESYFEVFEENEKVLLEKINNVAFEISKSISPIIFENSLKSFKQDSKQLDLTESTEVNQPYNYFDFSGISQLIR